MLASGLHSSTIMLASGLHSSNSANNLVADRGGDVLLPVRAVRDEVPAQAEGRAQGRHQAADLRHPTEVRGGKKSPLESPIPRVCTSDARRQTQVCLRVCTCADLRLAAEDLLLHKFARTSRLAGLSLADEKVLGFVDRASRVI